MTKKGLIVPCPKCGHECIVTRAEIKVIQKKGAPICPSCKKRLPENDIITEGAKIFEKKVRNAINRIR